MTMLVRTPSEIPDAACRKMVLTLMDRQAGREVATAEVFGQCVLYAPTVKDKIQHHPLPGRSAEALPIARRAHAGAGRGH